MALFFRLSSEIYIYGIVFSNRPVSLILKQLENRVDAPDLYIGVTTRKSYSVCSEKSRSLTSLAFHGIVE